MCVQHKQWIGTSWRVNGLGYEHENERQNECEDIDPGRVPKELVAAHTYQRTPKMTSEQGSGLCRRRTGQAEQEDRCATKRSKQENIRRRIDERKNEAKCNGCTCATPKEACDCNH